jgi:putative two-component system response regulator
MFDLIRFSLTSLFDHAYLWAVLGVFIGTLVVLSIVAVFRNLTRKLKDKNRQSREYRMIISQSLTAIANAIDAIDRFTSGHSARVAAYSVEIARHMGMDNSFVENIYYIGLLHDVGKIGIPTELINKPDKLTAEEFNTMKLHPGIGEEILKDITAIQNLTLGAAEHHERWDGGGYHKGLSSEEISLEARIIAAADTYDAMSTDRSYRKALPKEYILEEFARCRGSQFDPQVADAAIDLIERGHFNAIDIYKVIDLG